MLIKPPADKAQQTNFTASGHSRTAPAPKELSAPTAARRYQELAEAAPPPPGGGWRKLLGIPPSTQPRRLRILFLADDRHAANVVQDHVGGIAEMSRHRVRIVNPIHADVDHAISGTPFDVILIHYSIFILSDYFLPAPWRSFVRAETRPKVQIIQDEHRHIERMKAAMADLGIRAVLSSLAVSNLAKVYGGPLLPKTTFHSCLPGYIPASALGVDVPKIADRPLDVVYRGRDLPFKLGRFAQEKELIGRKMRAIAEAAGLKVDIEWEEGKRIYGRSWPEFLMSGRTTLGVEGGASIFDFHDNLDADIASFLEAHPGAGFEEVWQNVLADYEGNVVHKTITPKIFESIALKTPLILYPGAYRGVLEPGRHYIELRPDGSNADEVVARIRDTAYLQRLADRTYNDIMHLPELRKDFYVGQLDHILERVWYEERTATGEPRAFLRNLTALILSYCLRIGLARANQSHFNRL